ncbi:MAG: hypothetical protein GXP05_04190 [Alphaproteobacteria bacterium]|nr:hypothetical protein [Alphaproteobacteria bacterium]
MKLVLTALAATFVIATSASAGIFGNGFLTSRDLAENSTGGLISGTVVSRSSSNFMTGRDYAEVGSTLKLYSFKSNRNFGNDARSESDR